MGRLAVPEGCCDGRPRALREVLRAAFVLEAERARAVNAQNRQRPVSVGGLQRQLIAGAARRPKPVPVPEPGRALQVLERELRLALAVVSVDGREFRDLDSEVSLSAGSRVLLLRAGAVSQRW